MAANKIVDIQVCELQPPPPSEEGPASPPSALGTYICGGEPLGQI